MNAENNTRIDYSGNFLYENNVLKAIFTSAGRIISFNNNGVTLYKFEYNLQDHLGNTRVVFSGHSNGMPEVMQVTDYYPFGLVMNQEDYFADGVLGNKYLYNGKELQDDELAGGSLGWYDYGARMYDAELGRFHKQDRFAEKYMSMTSYHYAANNPILNIDVNGDSLMIVTLLGLDSKNPKMQERKYYVDSKVGYQLKGFVEDATDNFKNLSVNNVYRPFSSSDIKTSNTKASGLSRHQGGFAVDFNGVKNLSEKELQLLNKIAEKYGFAPLVDQLKDLPHFDTDPSNYGYRNLKEAVNENKLHYDDIVGGKSKPIEFNQDKYKKFIKSMQDGN